MKKKILVVDDSALMRRIVCDIINSDERFEVADTACNGLEALDFLEKSSYDAVVLDIVMPKMDGLIVLKEINQRKIRANVIMNSSLTKEGADVTIEALELGAVDFVYKPSGILDARGDGYKERFVEILTAVTKAEPSRSTYTESKSVSQESKERAERLNRTVMRERLTKQDKTEQGAKRVDWASLAELNANLGSNTSKAPVEIKRNPSLTHGKKIIALASSTGGPKALMEVIPKLPEKLNVPVLAVQHMPAGFTASLAARLDTMSKVHVKEAEEGEEIKNGIVYIAKGGMHMKVKRKQGSYYIVYGDEPTREGVKPCANYMYEALIDSDFDEICCVVMTGMGADGTEGIVRLKQNKKVHVIAQSEETCVVYGMPRSIVKKGLADEILPLEELAKAITKNVEV